jgi:hypothetical protein
LTNLFIYDTIKLTMETKRKGRCLHLKKTTIAGLAMAAMATFLIENKRSNTRLSKEDYIISSRKIPRDFDGKKIVFLSDLHNVELGKNNRRLLCAIDREQPDYIFVGGDMLVSKLGNHTDHALALLRELARRYPVYYANGNHEERLLWTSEECPEAGEIYRDYMEQLDAFGVHRISNETVKIQEGSSSLYLSGLEIGRDYYVRGEQREMPVSYVEEKLGPCRKDSFHILLAHNPTYFDTYADWGADLTLSGHLHGGIMRLPILGGVIAPSFQLFPKYDAGFFRRGKHRMIVSVGLGSHSIKIRLFNPPKFDVITLKREGRKVRP